MLFAVTDIETTGHAPSGNSITEVAVCIHDGQTILREWHSLINPHTPIPYYITRLTGITDEMLVDAPSFDQVAEELMAFFGDHVFVAHNVHFDHSFLQAAFASCGMRWTPRKLCTVRLTKRAFPGFRSYSLANLCRELEVGNNTPHRALGDARAAADIFTRDVELLGPKELEKLAKRGTGEMFLPNHLDAKKFHSLPTTAGIYRFHDAAGKIIYVGKAKNIHARVRSHFGSDNRSEKHQGFIREIQDISYSLTGTEMIALLVEDQEIRKYWPKYNSAQKNQPLRYGIFKYSDQNGLYRLAVQKMTKGSTTVKAFTSLTAAKHWLAGLARTHSIDLSYVGLVGYSDHVNYDVTGHNERIETALAGERNLERSLVMKAGGREPGEESFVLIDRGLVRGFGFIPDGIQIEHQEQLEEFIQPLIPTETNASIVRQFLEKGLSSRVIEW